MRIPDHRPAPHDMLRRAFPVPRRRTDYCVLRLPPPAAQIPTPVATRNPGPPDCCRKALCPEVASRPPDLKARVLREYKAPLAGADFRRNASSAPARAPNAAAPAARIVRTIPICLREPTCAPVPLRSARHIEMLPRKLSAPNCFASPDEHHRMRLIHPRRANSPRDHKSQPHLENSSPPNATSRGRRCRWSQSALPRPGFVFAPSAQTDTDSRLPNQLAKFRAPRLQPDRQSHRGGTKFRHALWDAEFSRVRRAFPAIQLVPQLRAPEFLFREAAARCHRSK